MIRPAAFCNICTFTQIVITSNAKWNFISNKVQCTSYFLDCCLSLWNEQLKFTLCICTAYAKYLFVISWYTGNNKRMVWHSNSIQYGVYVLGRLLNKGVAQRTVYRILDPRVRYATDIHDRPHLLKCRKTFWQGLWAKNRLSVTGIFQENT